MLMWRLKTYLEAIIETYNENKGRSDREWGKYMRKKREYHEKLDNYKSARRNLETKLDEQGDSLVDRITESL